MIFPDILLHLPGEPNTSSNEDADPSGIFEPTEQDVVFACKIADFKKKCFTCLKMILSQITWKPCKRRNKQYRMMTRSAGFLVV
jgi:hypothetical protein